MLSCLFGVKLELDGGLSYGSVTSATTLRSSTRQARSPCEVVKAALRTCVKIGRLLRMPLNVRDCVAVRENDGHLVH